MPMLSMIVFCLLLLIAQPAQDFEIAMNEDLRLADNHCRHLPFYNCACYLKKWRETRTASDPEIVSELGAVHFAEPYKSAVQAALKTKPGLFDACVVPGKVASYGTERCSHVMGYSGPASNSICRCTVAKFTRDYMRHPNPDMDYADNLLERSLKACMLSR